MNFDIGEIPFSRYGSYLAFSYPQDGTTGYENQIALRVLYGAFADQETYPILLCKEDKYKGGQSTGGNLTYSVADSRELKIEADEAELTVSSGEYEYKICFVDDETFLLFSNGPVRITRTKARGCDRIIKHIDGTFEMAGEGPSLRIWCRAGEMMEIGGDGQEGDGQGLADVLLLPGSLSDFSENVSEDEKERQDKRGLLVQISLSGLSFQPKEAADFELCVNKTHEEFQRFYEELRLSIGVVSSRFEKAMEQAAYILWHSVVHPDGNVSRPVMLMTKNWMNLVWSWDYTFNALAIAGANPKLAYDQYMAMADMQGSDGTYPDAFQAEVAIRSFVKPPVQGFMLKKMFAIHEPDRETKDRIYRSVAAFTKWWLIYRTEGEKLPFYNHGNDSGWDNATIFKNGYPVQSPDLAAWLVIQMEFLEETAAELGHDLEALGWRSEGEKLFRTMMEYFVRDGRFEAVKLPEREFVPSGSLILYLPLILGERLPEDLRERMVEDLLKENSLATDWGLASEPLDSPLFEEDGYWRGAIWPPTTLIMVEALIRCGKKVEALKYAERFCDMCARNGFYENYSAIDGHGLRDHGFTWTASVFLVLLRDYVTEL